MAQPDGIERRMSALEAVVERLSDRIRDGEERLRNCEQDAAAARVLAGGADRDVSEIRAEIREFREVNVGVLNAMRADMIDLREHVDQGFARVDQRFARVDQGFARVDQRFARVDQGFARVDQGFVEMRGLLDAAAAGQQRIVELLGTLMSRERGEGPDQGPDL